MTRTEDPVVRRPPPDRHSNAAPPDECRRHRGPTHVGISSRRNTPYDPRGRVLITGNPRPTVRARPHPTAVMEDDVAERKITDPDPVVVGVERPMSRRDVRGKPFTDYRAIGNPHDAVLRILDPGAVGIELGLERSERARIIVGNLRGRRGSRLAGRVLGLRAYRTFGCVRRRRGSRLRRRSRRSGRLVRRLGWSGCVRNRHRIVRCFAGLDAVGRTGRLLWRWLCPRRPHRENDAGCRARTQPFRGEPAHTDHGGIMVPAAAAGNQAPRAIFGCVMESATPGKQCELRYGKQRRATKKAVSAPARVNTRRWTNVPGDMFRAV